MKAESSIILVADNSSPTGEQLNQMLEATQKLLALLKGYSYPSASQVLTMLLPACLIHYANPPEQEFSQFRNKSIYDLRVVMMTNYTLEPDNKLCTCLGAQYFIAVANEVEIIQFRISEIHLN